MDRAIKHQKNPKVQLSHPSFSDSSTEPDGITSLAVIPQGTQALESVIPVAKIGKYLSHYRHEQLLHLVEVAKKDGADPYILIRFDHSLLLDECFSGREDYARFLASTHKRLSDLVSNEIERNLPRISLAQEISYINTLWQNCRAAFEELDEENAADRFELLLISPRDSVRSIPEIKLGIRNLSELFILFNFERSTMDDFVEFVEERINQEKQLEPKKLSDFIFNRLLREYLRENHEYLNLNSSSKIYSFAVISISTRKRETNFEREDDPDKFSEADNIFFKGGED